MIAGYQCCGPLPIMDFIMCGECAPAVQALIVSSQYFNADGRVKLQSWAWNIPRFYKNLELAEEVEKQPTKWNLRAAALPATESVMLEKTAKLVLHTGCHHFVYVKLKEGFERLN